MIWNVFAVLNCFFSIFDKKIKIWEIKILQGDIGMFVSVDNIFMQNDYILGNNTFLKHIHIKICICQD